MYDASCMLSDFVIPAGFCEWMKERSETTKRGIHLISNHSHSVTLRPLHFALNRASPLDGWVPDHPSRPGSRHPFIPAASCSVDSFLTSG